MASKATPPPDTLVSRRERAFTPVHYREIHIGRVLGATAFLVYTYLDLKAGQNEAAWPSIRSIAKNLGISTSTARLTVDKLIEHHLLIKESGNQQRSNRYVVLDVPDAIVNEGVSETDTGSDDGVANITTPVANTATGGVSEIATEETSSLKKSQEEIVKTKSLRKPPETKGTKERHTRIKNALVDATESNPETDTAWPAIGKAATSINKACQHMTDDEVVAEIYRRAKNYKREFSWMRLTAPALAKYWGECSGPVRSVSTASRYADWTGRAEAQR